MSDLQKQIVRNRITEVFLLLCEAADSVSKNQTSTTPSSDDTPAHAARPGNSGDQNAQKTERA